MSEYRLVAVDLLTGDPFGDLPLTGSWSCQRKRRDAGNFSASIPLERFDPALTRIDPWVFDDPPRVAIYILRDDVPLWGGPLWKTSFDDSTNELALTASEFWSLFKGQQIKVDRSYSGQDAMSIFRDLVDYVQSQPNRGFGIQVGTETCDRLVTSTYTGADRKSVADACAELANAIPDFDWSIDPAWDTSVDPPVLRPYLRLQEPRGAIQTQPFEKPFNILGYTWTKDATGWATDILGQGQGDGSSALVSAQALTIPGYPSMDMSVSWKDQPSQANLDALTTSQLEMYSQVIELAELTVRSDLPPELGSYDTGDVVPILIEDSYFRRSDAWSRDRRLNTMRRIESWRLDVDEDGGERVTLETSYAPAKLAVTPVMEMVVPGGTTSPAAGLMAGPGPYNFYAVLALVPNGTVVESAGAPVTGESFSYGAGDQRVSSSQWQPVKYRGQFGYIWQPQMDVTG